MKDLGFRLVIIVFLFCLTIDLQAEDKRTDTADREIFPLGVFYIMGQKPHIEDGVTSFENDIRVNPDVAYVSYKREFGDLHNFGFNTAVLMLNPVFPLSLDHDENRSIYEKRRSAVLEKLLLAADKSSIYLIPMMQTIQQDYIFNDNISLREALYRDYMDKFKDASSVLGYLVTDEPGIWLDMDKIVQASDAILKEDPDALALTTWNNADIYQELDDALHPEVIFMGAYPFAKDDYNADQADTDTPWGDLSDYLPRGTAGTFNEGNDQITFEEAINRAYDIADGRDIWVFFQAFGGASYWRDPLPNELKLQAFTAIKNGAKGLFYFLYQSEDWVNGLMDIHYEATARMAEAKEINQEVNALAPILLHLQKTNPNKASSSPFNLQTFVHENGEKYLIAVNPDVRKGAEGEILVEKEWIPNLKKMADSYTGETFSVTQADEEHYRITLTIDAAEIRVIRLDESAEGAPLPQRSTFYENTQEISPTFAGGDISAGQAHLGEYAEVLPEGGGVYEHTAFDESGALPLLGADEKFADFIYSLWINDDDNPAQTYKLGVRFAKKVDGHWVESGYYETSDVPIGAGWQESRFDFADIANQMIAEGYTHLSRFMIRGYSANGTFCPYTIDDVSIAYRTE